MNFHKLLVLMFLASLFKLNGQEIKVNQLGFYKYSQKIATVADLPTYIYKIVNADTDEVEYEGRLTNDRYWNSSGENVSIADFTDFQKEGNFYIESNGVRSYTFKIAKDSIFHELSVWTLKGFYMWRASIEIESQYATFRGIDYARPAGHPDTTVLVHVSAASEERPTGTEISSPKGWYDAGDYNKYVVNSGAGVFPLLHAYECFPEYYDRLSLNIPESNNNVPDILDEVKWNLDWVLTMQDPNDGGVYHKLTNTNFDANVMPHNATNTRYVVKKSTAAALNFAAMLAKAHRIFKKFDSEFPGYANQCLEAAEYAYQWAIENPSLYFTNPSGISTGQYGDTDVSDEFFWARLELYLSTYNLDYLNSVFVPSNIGVVSWRNVAGNGLLSVMSVIDTVQMPSALKDNIIASFNSTANSYLSSSEGSPYRVATSVFNWGSNGSVANIGLFLGSAYKYTKDVRYLNATLSSLDYLLGRNATPYSFISGFGTVSPMNIHCRRSNADGIENPIPGYVAGGPNATNTTSEHPAKSYSDTYSDYTTNEIAINWNAPLVFLVGAVESSISKMQNPTIFTDDTGTIINIQFPGKINGFVDTDFDVIVQVNNLPQTVNSIAVNQDFENILTVNLESPILANDTIKLSILNKFETDNFCNILNIYNSSVINNVTGTNPTILNVETDYSGDFLILNFNKELVLADTLYSSFYAKVYYGNDSTNLIEYAYLNQDNPTQLFLRVNSWGNTNRLVINYNDNTISTSEGVVINHFSEDIEINTSNIQPQLIRARGTSDGYNITVSFDGKVKLNPNHTPNISVVFEERNMPIRNIEILNIDVNDYFITLKLANRVYNAPIITVNFDDETFLNADDRSIKGQTDYRVTKNYRENDFILSSNSARTINSKDYVYCNNVSFYGTLGSILRFGDNSWADYKIVVENSGNYALSLFYTRPATDKSFVFQLVNEYETDDITTITIDNDRETRGTYTTNVFLEEGSYFLRINGEEGEAFSKMTFENVVSIKEPFNDSTSSVYPNITKDYFTIKAQKGSAVEIYTISGLLIEKYKMKSDVNTKCIETPGLYIINIDEIPYRLMILPK